MQAQIERYVSGREPFLERFAEPGMVIEVRANHMPDGGIVTTFTDITPSVEAAEALERANETLERRVRERTEELTRLNAALARAKGEADAANISKTKFLAAASHDILQPLNAARLYVTSLIERQGGRDDSRLVDNIDASLEAVEEIFGALLDMSRLDTGAMRPEFASFRIDELMRQIELEFAPLAGAKGLELTFVRCVAGGALRPPAAAPAGAEPRLQRHQIHAGRAACWSAAGGAAIDLRIDVYDTGVGIPESQQRDIFVEFHRLDQGARIARGLGLGLVDRGTRGARARLRDRGRFRRSAAARVSRSRCRYRTRRPVELPARDDIRVDPEPARRHHRAVHRQRTVGARRHGDLLHGWGCEVIKAPDLAVALAAIARKRRSCRTGCWSITTSTTATASRRSWRCAQRCGDLPAILITADRSPAVREQARAQGIQVLHKPIKPAALRALLAQWRVLRVAAAE